MSKELEQFLKDRNKIAISGKYEDYEKFCKKYNTPQAPNNEVFEIMIHKEMQEESKKWLLDRGFKLF